VFPSCDATSATHTLFEANCAAKTGMRPAAISDIYVDMKVLVTGASGYIGRHTLLPLLDSGCEVYAISRRRDVDFEWPRGVNVLTLDLFDDAARRKTFAEIAPQWLLHLAWCTEHGKFWEAQENIAWLSLSIRMLGEFAQNGGQRVVVSGTCAEYSWNGEPCREASTELEPRSLYGICKATLFRFLQAATPQLRLSYAWGRIFLLYGSGESEDRLIAATARALLQGRPALCTHGEQIRDFLHVEDVARALVGILTSSVNGAVNIGSGEPISIADAVSELARRAGRSDLLRLDALRPRADDVPVLIPDIGRLRDEVGFRPALGLGEGMQKTLAWWEDRLRSGERRRSVGAT
jgi:nucleoside-diphosphate-sugar epimerase